MSGATITKLPKTLSCKLSANSISMLRALKNVKYILEQVTPENEVMEDRIAGAIDDVNTMLDALD